MHDCERLVAHHPEWQQMPSPTENLSVWLQLVYSYPTSKAWCKFLGRIQDREVQDFVEQAK
eukprot:2624642-Karenia_brevis.AAC.1